MALNIALNPVLAVLGLLYEVKVFVVQFGSLLMASQYFNIHGAMI